MVSMSYALNWVCVGDFVSQQAFPETTRGGCWGLFSAPALLLLCSSPWSAKGLSLLWALGGGPGFNPVWLSVFAMSL